MPGYSMPPTNYEAHAGEPLISVFPYIHNTCELDENTPGITDKGDFYEYDGDIIANGYLHIKLNKPFKITGKLCVAGRYFADHAVFYKDYYTNAHGVNIYDKDHPYHVYRDEKRDRIVLDPAQNPTLP